MMTIGILISTVMLLLPAGASFAEDQAVLRIRKECQAVQRALPRLKAESLKLDGYSSEGGEATAFRDSKGDIRLIRVLLYFEMGKATDEYCYEHEHEALIFAFSKKHRYNAPFYLTEKDAKELGCEAFDPKKTTVSEDRHYFQTGRMILWLNRKPSPAPTESKEFKAAEEKALSMAKDMLLKFRRKH